MSLLRARAAFRTMMALKVSIDLAIAGLVIYLATAPKSNAAYKAFKAATKAVAQTGSLRPPAHILDAPTKLMKQVGCGADYAYDHDNPGGVSGQNCFPDGMDRSQQMYNSRVIP